MGALWCFPLAVLAMWLVYAPGAAFWAKFRGRRKLRRPMAKRQLALTFDDGPDERYTAALLQILARYEVKAVFFVVGNKALTRHHVVDAICAQGHQLGFHSMNHQNGLWLGPWRQRKDFRYWQAICHGCHWQSVYYRPPWGLANLAALYLARRAGWPVLYWSVLVGDWDRRNDAEIILQRLLASVRPGAVLCLHDSGEGTGGDADAAANTLAALEKFIPQMQNAGWEFVLPEAMAYGE